MFVCQKKSHFNPFLPQCAFGAIFAQNYLSHAPPPLASSLANPKPVLSGTMLSRDSPQTSNPVSSGGGRDSVCGGPSHRYVFLRCHGVATLFDTTQ